MKFWSIRSLFARLDSRKPRRSRAGRRRAWRSHPAVECLEDRTLLAVLTVTHTDDSGSGSLRQAIIDANNQSGPDTIEFNIPASDANFVDADSHLSGGDADPDVFVITPQSALPALTDDGTIIDGRTQTAFTGDTNPFGPEIVIDGSALSGGSGLTILSDNNEVHGLNIQGFSDHGVVLQNGSDNIVRGNYIGTDATGTEQRGNGRNGLQVTDGDGTRIGGTGPHEGNVIAGNTFSGVALLRATNTVVEGNLIGTDASGATGLGNSGNGIWMRSNTDSLIGGSTPAARNVISANGNNGIFMIGGTDHIIAGNFIGVDASGTQPLGNAGRGIWGMGTVGARIGTNGDGTGDVAERNVISANQGDGIAFDFGGANHIVAGNYIGVDADGTEPLGNSGRGILVGGSSDVRIGTDGSGDSYDATERNVIADSGRAGIALFGTTDAIVAGNYIGTDAMGSIALGNAGSGILGNNNDRTRVGTKGNGVNDEAERNVIAGNSGDGVNFQFNSRNMVIAGNYIGTDATGNSDRGNSGHGVRIAGGTNNRIGTDGDGDFDEAERNVISGNGRDGVRLASATDVLVAGNLIGVGADGVTGVGNGRGVGIGFGATSNVVGTAADGRGAANTISENNGIGITLFANSMDNVISGNLIVDNAGTGVSIAGGGGNRIGTNGDGTRDEEERNVISGNGGDGIHLNSSGDNLIAGNFIGVAADGETPQSNRHGVVIRGGASSNVVGIAPDGRGAGNVISGNTGHGALIQGNVTRVTSLSVVDQLISGDLPRSTASTTMEQADLRDQISGANGNWGFNHPVPGGGGDDYAVVTTGELVVDKADTYSFALSGDDGGRLRIDGNDVIVDDTLHPFLDRFGDVFLDEGTHTFEWVGFERGGGAGFELSVAVGSGKTGPVTTSNGWYVVGDLEAVPEIDLDGSLSVTAYYAEPVGGDHVVAGNMIGTDANGEDPVANSRTGILVEANNVRIGTDGDGIADRDERNVISGNREHGILINRGSDHVIAGNYIGTDANGDQPLGNAERGILVGWVRNVRIGTNGDGTADDVEGNVVSANGSRGIQFNRGANHLVAGNHIGVDETGTNALGNKGDGMLVNGSSGVRIGTNGDGVADTAEQNVISANAGIGIWLNGGDEHIIAGNQIGADANGTAGLGNGFRGINVQSGATRIRIGTDGSNDPYNAAERNIVVSNGSTGITMFGAADSIIAGNLVGMDAHGTIDGNNGSGIGLFSGAQNYRIGSNLDGVADELEANVIAGNGAGIRLASAAGSLIAGNTIKENTAAGIRVEFSGSVGNTIRRNSIHSNGGLGIDLKGGTEDSFGVTENDPDDTDSGPNQLQNFPVLTGVESGAQTEVSGSLQSTPEATFTLDFYANSVLDPSGHGEGQRWLGSIPVTTDANGDASFQETFPAATLPGESISATATDANGNTSEFSGVLRTAPEITSLATDATLADKGVEGEPVVLTGTFTDANPTATHTVTVDWGDGSTVQELDMDSGERLFELEHTYTAGGIYTIDVVLEDDAGGSDTATTTAVVTGIGIQEIDGENVLQIIGTNQDDLVTIHRQGRDQLHVHADFLDEPGGRTFPTDDIDRILVVLCDGDDHLNVAGNVTLPMIVDAGAGDDHVNGGGGSNVILGRDGDDMLEGDGERDILIGGAGSDRLVGDTGSDLLFGGQFSAAPTPPTIGTQPVQALLDDVQFLKSLQEIWDGPGTAEERQAEADALDGFFAALSDDDGAADKLTGGQGPDWFLLLEEDEATDPQEGDDLLTQLD